MKQFRSTGAYMLSNLLLPVFFRKRKAFYFLCSFLTLLALTGCFQHYFRSGTKSKVDMQTIKDLQAAEKYFVIHYQNGAKGLVNAKATSDVIEGDLVTLPPEHSKHLNPSTGKPNVVKKADKDITLAEVHLYVPKTNTENATHVSIPLSSVNRVDIYEFDQGATTSNHVLSWVGVGIAGAIVIFGIAFAIACNCPQVYVDNNGNYEFTSGVYSGAVYSSLERTDYLPLPSLNPADNTYHIKIGSMKEEEQFINSMSLLKIVHEASEQVLMDRHGNIFAFSNPEKPINAINNEGQDELNKLASKNDNLTHSFDANSVKNEFSQLNLNFKKPSNARTVKLIVRAKNSNWSGYVYKSFNSLFGKNYEKWQKEKEKSDPALMEQWQKEQALPLMVYVKTNKGWQFADYFAMTGNTASRDMIMQIDVSSVPNDVIEIKLETAFQFWDVDYAAVDFSPDKKLQTIPLVMKSAVKSNADEKASLSANDKSYCYLKGDESILLNFANEGLPKTSSYFLVSTGYYHNLQKFEGSTKLLQLQKFKKKGEFNNYSKAKYFEFGEEAQKLLVVK